MRSSQAGSKVDTVVPDLMPVPVIGIPAMIPLTLDTPVMRGLPLVTVPVGATVLDAEATDDMVTVPLAALIPPTVM